MLEKRRKEMLVRIWIEKEKERLLERAYDAEDLFLGAFYAQCIESTAADAHEVFLETPLTFNYFREKLKSLSEAELQRFFKLAA
ncbi:MAG: hypothetical protein IJN89_03820, partial [Anaerotignum sp.]|nr:hypothetical protein [Anaerotignum sp.]